MKLLVLVVVSCDVVTLNGPVEAPAGTVVWIDADEMTEKVALNQLKATVLTSLKSEPLIVTLVPTGPLVGAKLAMVGGGGTTVNALPLVAVPAGVVTLSGPLVAPPGTVAWIAVSDVTAKLAFTPLKATAVAPVKFALLIVTLEPTCPFCGEKPAIVGGGTTVNALLLVAVPPAVVTFSGPLVAPAGTVAWTPCPKSP